MKLLKLFSLTTSLLLLSHVAFAVQPAPKECPRLSKIKQAGFSHAFPSEGYYFIYQIDDFDTPQTWTFGMTLQAESSAEAKLLATNILNNLNTSPTPSQVIPGFWLCTYMEEDDKGIGATAMTIADDDGSYVGPLQVMQLMKK
ncbi:MAG: hypothetical protein A3I12_01265 [Gammaproteobacteria bacterium RIFCSPLOWO2_02_FULL_38_11]|nr:MAG: hypothetical protein A3B69_03690 [Gammaproteobacteria bacterium RIFCSPHIGHO2_02_FULL_38_33]OGT24057.1 MAG: hypothetical protein A2W47_00270 [Gammaproteobacteria bacterium RIFCSPHIGHO2_12_38_15]OGT67582.1 MAG: hypothetical protein A3I12_01265 [Gammaproteobacteria bacterium RIFCSPLOWO2_02_FULL_38_11]OGT77176.1 MAG: hypothetical protein A3G71_04135 [Gammaproteobacteria bacterium RIFCSPLOWO2_12_FULL_38_14]